MDSSVTASQEVDKGMKTRTSPLAPEEVLFWGCISVQYVSRLHGIS